MYTTTQPQAATSVPVQLCTVCHSYMYTDCSIGLILLCTHTLAMSLGMHPVLKTARDATAVVGEDQTEFSPDDRNFGIELNYYAFYEYYY